ncbi:MAG: RrF2 family transcriptional regulator [Hydrogenophaga sp.]|uniref:RrF2 family transcriptional regulator n=1 Tax=Hydrogenophaga sp. TaxID=1904254 RepID=UPI003D9AD22B
MISKKTQLCINILVTMASAPPSRAVNVQTLSDRLHVSISHLESVMRVLRDADLVRAARGPGGGYYLTSDPAELSVWEVVQRVNPALATTPDAGPQSAPIAGLEAAIHAAFADFLATQTIGDFAQQSGDWSAGAAGSATPGFRLRPLPVSVRPMAPNSVFQLSAFTQLRAA